MAVINLYLILSLAVCLVSSKYIDPSHHEKDDKELKHILRSSYEGYGNDIYGNEGYGHEGYGHEGYGHEGYGHEGYGHEGYGHEGYGHEGYESHDHNDLKIDKKDLVKEKLWLLKTTINELVTFGVAFKAKLLADKLKINELLTHKFHDKLFKKKHDEYEYSNHVKKGSYGAPLKYYNDYEGADEYQHDPYYGH